MESINGLLKNADAAPLRRSFLTLLAWLFLRVFFEGVLESTHSIGYIPFSYKALIIYFVHFPVFYTSLFLVLVMITVLITGKAVRNVTAVFSCGFGIVLLVPTLDWIIGGGYSITYPLRIGPYLLNSINPFVSISEYGGSPGQRIAFFLICCGIALYSYTVTRKIAIAVIGFILSYLAIILLGGLPTLVAGNRPELVYVTGGILYSDTQKFSALFLIACLCSACLYFVFLNRKEFILTLRSLRPLYMLVYAGAGVSGVLISLHRFGVSFTNQFRTSFDIVGIAVLALSLACAFQGAASVHDFFNTQKTPGKRTKNPLLAGVSKQYYTAWAIMLWCFALSSALLLSFVSFLIMLTLLCIAVLFSMPPVRLKRMPVVSGFTVAVTVMLAVAMGNSFLSGARAVNDIPVHVVLPLLIGVTGIVTVKNMLFIKT